MLECTPATSVTILDGSTIHTLLTCMVRSCFDSHELQPQTLLSKASLLRGRGRGDEGGKGGSGEFYKCGKQEK